MKSLLIIGLAFGLAACSDSSKKENAFNSDKDLLSSSESSRKTIDSNINKSKSLSITYKEREDAASTNSGYMWNAQKIRASNNSGAVAKSSRQGNKSASYKLSNFASSGSEINNLSYRQGSYTVNQNDTLMKIAFEIYGNYEQWRAIKKSNPDQIGSENIIKTGMILTYPEPDDKFVQNNNGDPYLIKRGDTLTSISKSANGTNHHWQDIWKNNTYAIKDPNLIFAGFTIYIPASND